MRETWKNMFIGHQHLITDLWFEILISFPTKFGVCHGILPIKEAFVV